MSHARFGLGACLVVPRPDHLRRYDRHPGFGHLAFAQHFEGTRLVGFRPGALFAARREAKRIAFRVYRFRLAAHPAKADGSLNSIIIRDGPFTVKCGRDYMAVSSNQVVARRLQTNIYKTLTPHSPASPAPATSGRLWACPRRSTRYGGHLEGGRRGESVRPLQVLFSLCVKTPYCKTQPRYANYCTHPRGLRIKLGMTKETTYKTGDLVLTGRHTDQAISSMA